MLVWNTTLRKPFWCEKRKFWMLVMEKSGIYRYLLCWGIKRTHGKLRLSFIWITIDVDTEILSTTRLTVCGYRLNGIVPKLGESTESWNRDVFYWVYSDNFWLGASWGVINQNRFIVDWNSGSGNGMWQRLVSCVRPKGKWGGIRQSMLADGQRYSLKVLQ